MVPGSVPSSNSCTGGEGRGFVCTNDEKVITLQNLAEKKNEGNKKIRNSCVFFCKVTTVPIVGGVMVLHYSLACMQRGIVEGGV